MIFRRPKFCLFDILQSQSFSLKKEIFQNCDIFFKFKKIFILQQSRYNPSLIQKLMTKHFLHFSIKTFPSKIFLMFPIKIYKVDLNKDNPINNPNQPQ